MKHAVGGGLLLVAGSILPAWAQGPPAKAGAGEPKIAVVQFQAAVTATDDFQRDFAEVQKKFEPKQAKLKNLSDEIDRLTKELEADGANMSEDERASRARTVESKKREADRLAQDDQTEYQHASEELFNRVAAKLGKVLTKYAQDHGFTLVMDRSEEEDQTPAVLWASPGLDITQPVVDAYNATSGVSAQGTAAKPAAAPKSKAP